MENPFFRLLAGIIILAVSGCSSVQFYSDYQLTKKSGLKYYTSKPFLLIERDASNLSIVKATIVYLPDLENPQYIAMKNGMGSKKLDVKLSEGSITTLGLDSDSKIEESIAALASLVSKTATAVTDLSTLKGIPGAAAPTTITELYDIIMSNGITYVKKVEVK